MLALQLVAGSHEPELREVPEPDPGPGQVLVRIGGAGACHSDLHLLEMDTATLPWPMPFTLGHENAGWVAAVGDGVPGLEVGEPVAVYGPRGCGHCRRCAVGMENYCERPGDAVPSPGIGADGGMAPLMLVAHRRYLFPLDGLDPVEAAPLTDAGLTPYAAIRRSRSLLGPGSHAVVIGVGGLGHLAIQILRALSPAAVIAVDTDAAALRVAADVGATHGVQSGVDGDHDTVNEIRDLTGGTGADVVLDLVGTDETLRLGAAVARPLGHLTIVGIAGGTLPVGFFQVPYGLSIASSYWGSLPELGEVLALARRGDVRARVERFALADAPAAYRAMRDHALEGRAVVVPDGQ
jgi:propanol-preferring alcohol dehydrogenase